MEKKFQQLIEKIEIYNKNADFEKIKLAYSVASKAHEEQKRVAGDPYIMHPLEVANILADLSLDSDSIVAGILHDVVEDSPTTYDEIKTQFGKNVADLVDGVTKLGRIPYSSKEEQQIENLRKMFLAMAKDIRVILIKLADRLHNMRTISSMPIEKQREKALETLEVYSPLAHRLGIQMIKVELEDISIRLLDPIACSEIEVWLSQRMQENEAFLSNITENVGERLKEAGLKYSISSRTKHIYSIYRKMYTQNRDFDEIYDLFAIRIIVDTTIDCYNVLGVMHDMFKPIPRRFKDYISTPKPNMYQSLHTTVIGKAGVPFEVQIRTPEMDEVAEMGIAAHWKYKQGMRDKSKPDENLLWVRQLLEIQKDSSDPDDLMRALKIDMFADEVFVFSPKGDVLNLPLGSTVIDYAYTIHSALGNKMTGGKVNGRIVPIDYVLQNGDIVEIIRSASSKGPSLDWLKMCKTSGARNKIRQWFKKEKREENIGRGKEEFEKELKRNGILMSEFLKDEIKIPILNRFSTKTLDDLYASIGYGGISINKVILRILSEFEKQKKQVIKETPVNLPETPPSSPAKNYQGILVEGIDNCLVKLARCCNPLPGDDIVGYITKGFGVSIHKRDCVNVINNLGRDNESDRWVQVHWTKQTESMFVSTLQIVSRDRINIVSDVCNMFSAAKIKMQSINARETKDGFTLINVSIEVKSLEQLENIMNKLSKVSGVVDVSRATQ